MAIEFYDVKKREKVQIPESEVSKTTYERQGKDGKTQDSGIWTFSRFFTS